MPRRWRCGVGQGGTGSYKFGTRYLLGTVLGSIAFILALTALENLGELVEQQRGQVPRDVTFLAPVQQPGSVLSVEVANVTDQASVLGVAGYAWPALFALVLWGYGWITDKPGVKTAGWILGWTLLAWAALRCPNGGTWFLMVIAAFLVLRLAIPALRQLWRMPRQPQPTPSSEDASGAASSTALLLVGGLLWLSVGSAAYASSPSDRPLLLAQSSTAASPSTAPVRKSRRAQRKEPLEDKSALLLKRRPVADAVAQDMRIEDKFALATAKIRWQAEKGQRLPLLLEPAVLTRIYYPSNALKLVLAPAGTRATQELLAEKSGAFDIEIHYEMAVTREDAESGLTLPVPYGLINRLDLTVANLDVDVLSPQAVSLKRETAGSNTVARLVLAPVGDTWIGWRPRSRDVKREKPVFYADVSQLYVPTAGVIEGAHYVSIRPAQGELSELVLEVPSGATVTDVIDPARSSSTPAAQGSLVSLWRFDPDARKLRITLNPPQSRPFALLVRSQVAAGTLPFEQQVGLLSVDNAAGQIGLLGVATGNEVQLDTARAEGFSAINLEDFPANAASALQARIPGLTVRRAFRYADTKATAFLKASAVEPDVRVEAQDTLSLGEDRTVLAVNATVNITRAGIFRLSFVMPAGFEVESISGSALSHWTELKADTGRVITLHLPGKTEGQQQFAISLGRAGGQSRQGLGGPATAAARSQQATRHAAVGAGARHASASGGPRGRHAVGPAEIGHPAERRARVPGAASALEPHARHRAGGPLDSGHKPSARDRQ